MPIIEMVMEAITQKRTTSVCEAPDWDAEGEDAKPFDEVIEYDGFDSGK